MIKTRTTRTRRGARRERGAVMVETVIVLPFIMVMILLIVYLGMNFRRLEQVTNMDRYVAWQWVTPGAPGPRPQHIDDDMRNPRLNNMFYGLSSDQAIRLDERRPARRYTPLGHEELRDRQSDEAFSYFDDFIENNRRGIYERFEAQHEQISDKLTAMGMSDLTQNTEGHSRLDGDWRFANGVRYRQDKDRWDPARYRVSPAPSLREVFYVEYDDGMQKVNNSLGERIRGFYMDYPGYFGPDITDN